jgi:hypothetical protein
MQRTVQLCNKPLKKGKGFCKRKVVPGQSICRYHMNRQHNISSPSTALVPSQSKDLVLVTNKKPNKDLSYNLVLSYVKLYDKELKKKAVENIHHYASTKGITVNNENDIKNFSRDHIITKEIFKNLKEILQTT